MNSNSSVFKFDLRSLFAITVLTLPLSIKVFFEPANTQVIYPGEIFIGLLTFLFFVAVYRERKEFFKEGRKFFRHPISILVYCYVIINIISLLLSSMFLVSLKATIVKLCYVTIFYFMTNYVVRSNMQNYFKVMQLYGIGLVVVVIYTLAMHFHFGLTKANSGHMSVPFFNDHTIYAAAVAFFIPALLFISSLPARFSVSRKFAVVIISFTVLFLIAVFFAFSRAAWISLAGSLILFVLILTGLRFRSIVILTIITAGTIFFARHTLLDKFRENKIDSNRSYAGIYEQIFSVTNLSNDISNLERFNRWHSAYRMFLNKPLAGFGPGTYQFQYIRYQDKNEMSYISMDEPLPVTTSYHWTPEDGLVLPKEIDLLRGRGGTAHSEYLLALSEGGIFSFIIFIGFLVLALYTAMKIYSSTEDRKMKTVSLIMLLCLATYFVHGLFNNYLDDCKLAFLFWGTLSGLAMLDSFTGESQKAELSKE
jgi:putative inorganic carbon (hco3(-)) transporter